MKIGLKRGVVELAEHDPEWDIPDDEVFTKIEPLLGIFVNELNAVLRDNAASVCLYGSCVLDDFHGGWSDIDFIALTDKPLTREDAEQLVELRQRLVEKYGNPLFCSLEGGILSREALLSGRKEPVVYWGTSGQRITDSYNLDCFGTAELLESGILLYGDDFRSQIAVPTYAKMRDEIARHCQAARKYGVSIGWLLDIARGIYTLRTGKVIAKTAAGEWALENSLCPDEDTLRKAVQIRYAPLCFSGEDKRLENEVIQRFADVLEEERSNTIQLFAESELQRMGISCGTLSLIRNKDDVSVWRVSAGDCHFVMKCFDKPEYRREISNYQILSSIGVPTLKMINNTDCSLLMEDIEYSSYRLGTVQDINDPQIVALVARWYKILHEKGRVYANTHSLYDECDCLTIENLKTMQAKTKTETLPVWRTLEEHFDEIRTTALGLPRTLTYNDFHYTNLVVARDGSSTLMFDYNMLGKGYVYADIRNVCGHLGNEEARAAFQAEYGSFDGEEKLVDDVVNMLTGLHIACQKESFPDWGNVLLDMVKNGELLTEVEKLLARESKIPHA